MFQGVLEVKKMKDDDFKELLQFHEEEKNKENLKKLSLIHIFQFAHLNVEVVILFPNTTSFK